MVRDPSAGKNWEETLDSLVIPTSESLLFEFNRFSWSPISPSRLLEDEEEIVSISAAVLAIWASAILEDLEVVSSPIQTLEKTQPIRVSTEMK